MLKREKAEAESKWSQAQVSMKEKTDAVAGMKKELDEKRAIADTAQKKLRIASRKLRHRILHRRDRLPARDVVRTVLRRQGHVHAGRVNVNPRAVINQITRSAAAPAPTSNCSVPRPTRKTVPKNSDIGGHHIAFYVDDIEAAADYLKAKNVEDLQGPIPIKEGPAAGQSILYFFAPWGLQMELISYPKGMAYQKDAKSVLWMTTEPGK